MKRFALTLIVLSGIFIPILQYRTIFAQATLAQSGSGSLGNTVPTAPKLSASQSSGSKRASGSRQGDEVVVHRLREGTTITNQLGRFRQSGGRATFVTEKGLELGGLPNLNLERVVRMLKSVEEADSIWWSVSGSITEFSGRNYILIKRAVYKSATPPPRPEKLDE